MSPARRLRVAHPSSAPQTLGRGRCLIEAEAHLRQAGRWLELLADRSDVARLAGVSFRLASQIRSDRLGDAP